MVIFSHLRMTTILTETIRLMEEIDKAIADAGELFT